MKDISTPLRYPGGKHKIWHHIAELISLNASSECEYIEPYAGGAGIAFELLRRKIVSRIHINDINPTLFAFWQSVLNETSEICELITNIPMTVKEWEKQKLILKHADSSTLEKGFALLYLNRTNFSGIISAGIIGGKEQKGTYKMDARFPKKRIISLIEEIASEKEKISLTNMDAIQFIGEVVPAINNRFLYCDPPYYVKGRQLYLDSYKPDDHAAIANLLTIINPEPWIVSYDNAPEIKALYENFRQLSFDLQYSARTKQKGKELLILSPNLKVPANFMSQQTEEIPDCSHTVSC